MSTARYTRAILTGVGERVPLTRTRIQVAHGTVPLKCARNTLPARPGILYRPALQESTLSPGADFSNAPQRRDPTDVVAFEIDLVGAHDAHHSLHSRGIGIAHGRAEECSRGGLPRSRSFRVHDFRGFDSLPEKANPPIDLPQPPLAVLIVGVFTAIAVTGSPRHYLRHGRAFPAKQKPVLIAEALQPARRYVVLALRRGLVRLWFSREPFSHLVVLPAQIQSGHSTLRK